ncbi:MAG: hypothetical protein ACI90V_006111 [Bacillariaceae sp.]|jgi:hypothetical protein
MHFKHSILKEHIIKEYNILFLKLFGLYMYMHFNIEPILHSAYRNRLHCIHAELERMKENYSFSWTKIAPTITGSPAVIVDIRNEPFP